MCGMHVRAQRSRHELAVPPDRDPRHITSSGISPIPKDQDSGSRDYPLRRSSACVARCIDLLKIQPGGQPSVAGTVRGSWLPQRPQHQAAGERPRKRLSRLSQRLKLLDHPLRALGATLVSNKYKARRAPRGRSRHHFNLSRPADARRAHRRSTRLAVAAAGGRLTKVCLAEI